MYRFGIGLDDAFILYTAYLRTDSNKTAADRVQDTVSETGVSIFMTTSTSVLAFSLGITSTIPAIRWLCMYAAPTIWIDFCYQITFFLALVVLDQRRIDQGRRDCLVCFRKSAEADQQCPETDSESEKEGSSGKSGGGKHFAEHVMTRYADFLMLPSVKVFVILAFAAFFGLSAVKSTQLELAFDFTSILPSDSYVIGVTEADTLYGSGRGASPYLYFRFVDQSDPAIQAKMESYVQQIVALDQVGDQPLGFWLRDFQSFEAERKAEFEGVPFKERMNMFLQHPVYRHLHKAHIEFDENGDIAASRTRVNMLLDQSDADEILNALHSQRRVSSEQLVNQVHDKEWAFFAYDHTFNLWEFLSVTWSELRLTTRLGITAVSLMGLFFLPHWSGILFVGALIGILYIDLMAVLQLANVTMNGVTYVALVMR